jgi:hypothetical protein
MLDIPSSTLREEERRAQDKNTTNTTSISIADVAVFHGSTWSETSSGHEVIDHSAQQ